MENVIDVGQYIISKSIEDSFKIYGLSSCIGLVIYCESLKVLGVAHILLPSSNLNPELSKISPAYFADTGVTALINEISSKYSCKKENIVACIYGGADAKSNNDIFNIGTRNVAAVKSKLYEHNVTLKTAHTGGKLSRTLSVDVKTGKVNLNIQNFL